LLKLLLKDVDSFAGKIVHRDDGDIYELERVNEIENPELAEFERNRITCEAKSPEKLDRRKSRLRESFQENLSCENVS
jgi:hypothetical protein